MSTRATMGRTVGGLGWVFGIGAAPVLLSMAGCAAPVAFDEPTSSTTSALTAGTSVGTSTMVIVRSSSCVDVQGGSTADVTPVIQYHCAGGANQQLTFVSNGNANEYAIVAAHSGKCLDVAGGSLDAGAPIIQYTCSGSANQTFVATALADGSFQLVAKHSGMCLDVMGGTTADVAPLIQYPCQGSDNEHFRVDALSAPPPPSPPMLSIVSGDGQFKPWYQASSAPPREDAGMPIFGKCPDRWGDLTIDCVVGTQLTQKEWLATLPGNGVIYDTGFGELRVKVVDATGNPLPGVQVAWTASGQPLAPIGVIAAEQSALRTDFACSAPSAATMTDENGVARQPGVNFFTAFRPTALELKATYGASTVTFHLNATEPTYAPPPPPPHRGPVNM